MNRRPLQIAVMAGLAYFAIVFTMAFALGTLRVLVVIPRLGEIAAVLMELPVLLVVSWVVCRWLVARLDVPPAWGIRMIMSATAFAALMLAELGGGTIGFGRTLPEYLEQYRQVSGVLGLAGQIAFATFPLIQRSVASPGAHPSA